MHSGRSLRNPILAALEVVALTRSTTALRHNRPAGKQRPSFRLQVGTASHGGNAWTRHDPRTLASLVHR